MAKPTNWNTPGEGKGATRTSRKGNTVHRQPSEQGGAEHVNRKDGTSVRTTEPTTDPKVE